MGTARAPERAKLIVGLIANNADLFSQVRSPLEKIFKNKIDYESRILDFTHTAYYQEEMGGGLKRKFLSFKKAVAPENIYSVKLKTNILEKKMSVSGARAINIDPGYITLSKLILFSTKDYTHRLYLNKGIYGEVTLYFKDKTFRAWPWTYPDYKSDDYIKIFNEIRDMLKSNHLEADRTC